MRRCCGTARAREGPTHNMHSAPARLLQGLLRLGDAATGRTQPSHATRAATGGGGVERSGWSAATHSLLKQRQRAIMAPPADMAVVYPSFELQRVHSQPAGHGSQDKQGKGGAGGTITIRAVAGPAGRRRARSFSLISADTTELADRPARSLGGAGAGAATAAQAAGERAPAAPAKAAAAAAPRAAEGPVSAEHLAMLDGLRAQWQVPKGAPLWRKLQA